MMAAFLYLCVMCLFVFFSLLSFEQFMKTRDNVYAFFFAVCAMVIVVLTLGFVHFKPWLN